MMSIELLIDKGNQSCKIATFEGSAISRRWIAMGDESRDVLTSIIEEVGPARVAFSSVVPEWTQWLRRQLESLGVADQFDVGGDISLPFEMRVELPGRVGTDRICAAAGALSLGYREAVIVDAGTAVTVDLLSERGFLGGSIFPGLDLLARSLGSGTASLPDVVPDGRPRDVPGGNTEDAIACGVYWGHAGAVKQLVNQSVAALSPDAGVVVTGGWADAVVPHLGLPFVREPDLTFIGLHFLLEYNTG
jgi:type III pantothenate kinase